jgi:hypothetical protein
MYSGDEIIDKNVIHEAPILAIQISSLSLFFLQKIITQVFLSRANKIRQKKMITLITVTGMLSSACNMLNEFLYLVTIFYVIFLIT